MSAQKYEGNSDNGSARSPENSQHGDLIAIVGMGCRFPGSEGLAEFWRLLVNGENWVVEGPPGSIIGRSGPLMPDSGAQNDAVRFGGHVQDIELFDAEFFRMSPVEAQMLDPQQRLMLETSWRALEDAGIDPDSLKGTRTGVYGGISRSDYRDMALYSSETSSPAGGLYAATGCSLNTAMGRVSFALGLEGPAVAIDTACSSSLVAIHQAIGGLQHRDVDLALAGGVMLHLAGRTLELEANAGMLSPGGQCKTFDAAADGFVCGEGCGLLVLKRLSEAQADGDRIWAVIRGSAVNHDGASQGLTVPSGPSQELAMEEALARAGLSPTDVDYLEAHGTGTKVGDPIELKAAASVLGRGRTKDDPLLIGSLKTNIGHPGCAAGVAGVIKSVLAMTNGVIPRHLHFNNPTPEVDWDRLPLRVTDVMMDWPRHPDRPPRAAVNSFGWSGTNAHIVVEGLGVPDEDGSSARMSSPNGAAVPVALPDAGQEEAPQKRATRFLPLSAKSPAALQEAASDYLSWLGERPELRAPVSTGADALLSDMAWTAAIGRSHFSHRSGIVFSDGAELREKLLQLAEGDGTEISPGFHAPPKVAFVFTGQASQWVGMGRSLYEREPVFRSVLDRCDQLLAKERGARLLDVMFGRAGQGNLLDEPAWVQPAIYALECALVALWASVGIRPDVVAGHSLGELAASQAAGVFTLEQGLLHAAARGNIMSTTRGDGAMAAVFTSGTRVVSALSELNANSDDVDVSIAAYNGPQQVVSGPVQSIEALQTHFEAEGVKVVRLKKSPAYHSAMVEPILDELETTVSDILGIPPSPAIPLISSLTGQLIGPGDEMNAVYWRRLAREAVQFSKCVQTLAELEVDVVVEVGPHAVLGTLITMGWPESAAVAPPVNVYCMMRPPRDADASVRDTSDGFVAGVAAAYEAGLDIDFSGLFAGERRRRIALPGYPFQRIRYWPQQPKAHQRLAGHPLLGTRQELARGEVVFETEMSPSDPAWMMDHLVFGRVVAPGALYGAMAVSVAIADGADYVVVDDLQMQRALVFTEKEADTEPEHTRRRLQFVLDAPKVASERRFEIYSKGVEEEDWVLHAAGALSTGAVDIEPSPAVNLNRLKAALTPWDTAQFYETRFAGHINLGPPFHTLHAAWAKKGEALAELVLQESVDAKGVELHPLLLDGCLQVFSIGRYLTGTEQGAAYLPFGWERLWVRGTMPERVWCHAVLRDGYSADKASEQSVDPPEVFAGDVQFYSADGTHIGGLLGFTVKRVRRTDLVSAKESLDDLMYEVAWQLKALGSSVHSAFLHTDTPSIARQVRTMEDYLQNEGVGATERLALLNDLERLSQAYVLAALDHLGWERTVGTTVRPDDLRHQLNIAAVHRKLFERMLYMLSDAGVLTPADDGFIIVAGAEDHLPDPYLTNPAALADQVADQYPHGAYELGLLRRCGTALADVLQGHVQPLPLIFSDDGTGAADYYVKAPVSRAANAMLGDAIAAAASGLTPSQHLRVVEVGAGTGSSTERVLPELPQGRFNYTFTDISAGFFAPAEARFAGSGVPIEYQPLNIEVAPSAQGFEPRAYDLLIAAKVLHATIDLGETLAHCRELLAPSGLFIAVEAMQRWAWQDLTFGLLDGWWRFADAYRSDQVLADPDVWRRALGDAGFTDIEILGPAPSGNGEFLGSNMIVARAPADEDVSPGAWVLAADESGIAGDLARELVLRNQTVILARDNPGVDAAPDEGQDMITVAADLTQQASWKAVLKRLPGDVPLKGVVHLLALDGHGAAAKTSEVAKDVKQATSTALALVQGILDAGATPTEGLWLVTRGAQVMEHDYFSHTSGELAGATLWGLGKVIALESAHMQPRMIDLDPTPKTAELPSLVDELLLPDAETHVSYRDGTRHVARLTRVDRSEGRLTLPENVEWCVGPDDPELGLASLKAKDLPRRPLRSGEIRVAADAVGLNFADMLVSTAEVWAPREIGREVCGRVIETAPDVEGFAVGDQVIGIGFGAFGPEFITSAVLSARVPAGFSSTALATLPICFVTADLSFKDSGLSRGERVLIHAGAGGVGLAAIQLAHAMGAEVFTTASKPKQAFLRSLGVEHVFDSRTTAYGEAILDATGGQGVHVVLNSLTGEGFVEASLSCLGRGGRFVEISKRNIWSAEKMAEVRPDVSYSRLDVDALKYEQPTIPGDSLSSIANRLAQGQIQPLPRIVWPLSEIRVAMQGLRNARHIGKNVFRMPSLARGQLRKDRTYLITGGLGGLGCAVAEWLANHGAGTVVLNGRRPPGAAATGVIQDLQNRGVDVRVEVVDVTDLPAVDDMLARMDATLPPLGGVIHSVGVLSDGAIENQTWERFERVMWPKVLGAWHLHQATIDKDLDLFVLFSSLAGVVGNPGQSNHAAANAFLDQLAVHRRALGLPGQAIAWGAWSDIGEAEEHRGRIERQLAYTGTGWHTPEQGMQAFDWLVRQDITTPTVSAIDWSALSKKWEFHPPFLEEVLDPATPKAKGSDDADSGARLVARLRELPANGQQSLLESLVQQELQTVLRLSSPPASTVSFFDIGMDSLMAVELRNRLNRRFNKELTVTNTAVFDFPNAASLSRQLVNELEKVGATQESTKAVDHKRQRPAPRMRSSTDVAVVGIACRFPGAPNLSAYWRLLKAGAIAVTDGRDGPGPWDGVLGDPGAERPIHRKGGFVAGLDQFDAEFFSIRPIHARAMDPQQRMLLEVCWQALEDAGIDPARLRGSRSGVYFGISASEYRNIAADHGELTPYFGNAMSMAAGRISFEFGMEGPAVPVDLACASALVSTHQAIVGLQTGETDLALAGGVNAILSKEHTSVLADVGILSLSGHCRSLDALADGYVRGEGCGVIVLKRLEDAQADGDRIWGVISGSATNQNGSSGELAMPSGPAQQRVITEALAKANRDPSDVDYLEAHANGSDMGDAIEIQAAAAVFGEGRDPARPLLLGSAKPNVGHLESAAGIAGLIKVLLSLHHGVIPPHRTHENLNPNIPWDALPVHVATRATTWPITADRPPCAGVSAQSLSGTNAHLIVEGYQGSEGYSAERANPRYGAGSAQLVPVRVPESVPVPQVSSGPRRVRLLPLSGKSGAAVCQLAEQYLWWLDDCADELSDPALSQEHLSDMAWTAGTGRSHFAHRAAIPFTNAAALRKGLRRLVDAGSQGRVSDAQVAFAYTGEDERYVGLGAALYESEPVVRAILNRCDQVFQEQRGRALLDAIFDQGKSVHGPAWMQPAVYALECALTALWLSIGLKPRVVYGEGGGAIAAAYAADMFTLEEGLRFASNCGALLESFSAEHTTDLAPEDLERALRGIRVASPSMTMVNAVTGQSLGSDEDFGGAYWCSQVRDSADADGCTATLRELGINVVVELGSGMPPGEPPGEGRRQADKSGMLTPLVLPGLERGSKARGGFVEAVARAYETGLTVDFTGLFAGEQRRRIPLPGYPFQRKRYWFDAHADGR